jgi:ATP-dependent Clp protease adapter protein ClpS
MLTPFEAPHIVDSPTGTGRWMVVIFNNDENTIEEVIEVLMRSTGCSANEAYIETWEAHTYGKAYVHFSDRTECEIVAHMISSIGVKTEVRREWDDGA